jgi:hypothetical protein
VPEFIEVLIVARDLASGTVGRAADKMEARLKATKTEAAAAGLGLRNFGKEMDDAGGHAQSLTHDLDALGAHSTNAGRAMERMSSHTVRAGVAAEQSARRHEGLLGALDRLITTTGRYVAVQATHLAGLTRNSSLVRRLETDVGRLGARLGQVSRAVGFFTSGAARATASALGWVAANAKMVGSLGAAVGGFVAIGGAMVTVIGVFGGLTAATVAFVSALGALSGALVAIPAGFAAIGGAAAAVLGILKPATSGIFAFLHAQGQAAKAAGTGGGGGGGGASNAQGVADAERALARARVQATQSVGDAERTLGRVRQDSIVQNRAAEEQLRRTRVDAVNAVITAEEHLQQVLTDNARQRAQLQQSLADAQAALAGEGARGGANVGLAQAGVGEAQFDLNSFNTTAAGTESAARRDLARTQIDSIQRITDAERNLQQTRLQNVRQISDAERSLARARVSATQSVTDAERALQRARQASSGAGSAAANAVTAAWQKLSPVQRQIAREIQLIKQRWQELTAAAKGRFLAELLRDAQLVNRLLPMLAAVVSRFADAFTHALATVRAGFNDPAFVRAFQRVGTDMAGNFDRFLQAVVRTGQGFVYVLDAARPFLDWLGHLTTQWGNYFLNASKADDANGRLARFFRATRQVMTEVGHILRDLGVALFNVGRISFPQGRGLLGSLAQLAKEFRRFTEDHPESVRRFIDNGIKVFHAFARLIETASGVLGGVVATALTFNGPINLMLGALTDLLKLPFAGWLAACAVQLAIIARLLPFITFSQMLQGIKWAIGGLATFAAELIGFNIAIDSSTVLVGIFGVTLELAILPITAVVAAIAGLILIGVALWKNWFGIRDKAAAAWNAIKGIVLGHWRDIVAFLAGPLGWVYLALKFTGLWDDVKGIFTGAWSWISSRLPRWWNSITGWVTNTAGPAIAHAFGAVWGGVTSIVRRSVNGIVGIVEGFINTLIHGVNWILRHIGLGGDQIGDVHLPTVGGGAAQQQTGFGGPHGSNFGAAAIPRFEEGGVVPGPEGQPALILAHGGEVVLNRRQQRAGVAGSLVGGLQDIGGGALGAVGDVANFLSGIAGDVGGFISDHLPHVPDLKRFGVFGKVAVGAMQSMYHRVYNWVKGKVTSLVPDIGFGGGAGGGVTISHPGLIGGRWGGIDWGTLTPAQAAAGFGSGPVGYAPGDRALSSIDLRTVLAAALAATGHASVSNLYGMIAMALGESGGHTGIINQNDINWLQGTPSVGLLQTIFATFMSYAASNLRNILDPFHNAIAAIRYQFARYGRIVGHPGYASGGVIGEQEGWMGLLGQAVPILAHVGEWVLNPQQQLRLAAAVGGMSRARELVFDRRSVPTSSFAGGGIVMGVSPFSPPQRAGAPIGRDVHIEMPIYTSSPLVDVDYVAAVLEQRMQRTP